MYDHVTCNMTYNYVTCMHVCICNMHSVGLAWTPGDWGKAAGNMVVGEDGG